MAEDSIAQDLLQNYVERAERLNAEKTALNDDLKELFGEARGNGFDVKVLKAIIADRAKDPNKKAEFEALFELYADALGMNVATRALARRAA